MKVTLIGYYGFGNLGDEALLSVLLDNLNFKKIFVLDYKKEKRKKSKKIDYYNRYNPFLILLAFFRSKILIFGGGSIFQDKTSNLSFYYYFLLFLLAKLMFKKVALIAQGIGPINKKTNLFLIKFIINYSQIISLRDKDSFDFVAKNTDKKNFYYTADLAFLMEAKKDFYDEAIEQIKQNYFSVLCILRNTAKTNIEIITAKLKEIAQNNQKVAFVFVNFQDADIQITRQVKERIDFAKTYFFKKKLDQDELISFFTGFKLVFSIRLHGLIFAKKSRLNFETISYDPKIDSFLTDQRELFELENQAKNNFRLLEKLL